MLDDGSHETACVDVALRPARYRSGVNAMRGPLSASYAASGPGAIMGVSERLALVRLQIRLRRAAAPCGARWHSNRIVQRLVCMQSQCSLQQVCSVCFLVVVEDVFETPCRRYRARQDLGSQNVHVCRLRVMLLFCVCGGYVHQLVALQHATPAIQCETQVVVLVSVVLQPVSVRGFAAIELVT